MEKSIHTRVIAMIVASVMLLGMTVTVSSADSTDTMPYTDVKSSAWYYDSVLFAYQNGLMNGMTETTFAPTGTLTRAMFVTILCRLEGGEQKTTSLFSDVPSKSWYAGCVGWAAETGVVNGYPDGTFRPMANITRQEMATAMAKYIAYTGDNMPRRSTAPVVFADSGKIADWAYDYVEVLRRAGIVNGDQNEKFNPKANITRAESATIIMNLIDAQQRAWQGYMPDPEEDGYGVYGAAYLYYNGTAVSGGLGTELVSEEGEMQYLSCFYDETTASYHSTPADSTGICTSVFDDIDLRQTPVMKIAYSYDGYDPEGDLAGRYVVNPCFNDWSWRYYNVYINEPFTFTEGASDGEYRTATYDLTAFLEANPTIDDTIDITHLLAEPEENDGGEIHFNILYIALFSDQESADAFTSSALSDYLVSFESQTDTEFNAITDEEFDSYISDMKDRINEIKDAESYYTPEEIEAAGGTCWYVSSINGSSSNDGRSPETAFEKPIDLWTIKAGGIVWLPKPEVGDGVFFERGSVWYADTIYGPTSSGLTAFMWSNGIFYSAYGEGEKPAFYGALDFSEDDETGVWDETEWDNIYVLNEKYDEYLATKEIGNIIFDEGRAIGIRVRCSDNTSVFGSDKTTMDYGLVCPDGELVYSSGGTACSDPSDALHNNYEFFHDMDSRKLYLYWDKGNPSDSFDDIKVSRTCVVVCGEYATGNNGEESPLLHIDNLSVRYSGSEGMVLAPNNSLVTNCESGYIGGATSSVAGCIGVVSGADVTNIKMIHNYCHDVQDAPISVQNPADDDQYDVFRDIEVADSVFASSGNGVEIWLKPSGMDENGYAHHVSYNVNVHDNYMAYTGYGICLLQEEKRLGTVFCMSNGYEMVDSKLENNVVICAAGEVGITSFSSDTQKRGYELIDNVYIIKPDLCYFTWRRDNFNNYWHHNLGGYGHGVKVPYSYRYLTYMASLGIGNREKYYYIDEETTELEKNWVFFMTGYYLEK